MAFQPIVDVETRTVRTYEALVRGPENQPASEVLAMVNEKNRYAFDQACRVKAIRLASELGMVKTGARLAVNFMPEAIYSPSGCIQKTLRAARQYKFPLDRLIFEITEHEPVRNTAHLKSIIKEYKKHGFGIALDDFGAGYNGLSLLAELDPDIVKLDARLIKELHLRPRSQAIVRAMTELCKSLDITVVGEAIETVEECEALQACGVHLMQGFFFAQPLFEGLPEVTWR
ncbi:EAL domain-containing protein [Terriglobus saanensis]|nr:EAL domain-containing protein [Terriglobus saanensis]